MIEARGVLLAIAISAQFPNFSYASQRCDDLLDCENSAFDAVVLAETLRDQGYGVKWETVKYLDKLHNRLTTARFMQCNFSEEFLEDESQRAKDRLIADIMNPRKTEVQIFNEILREAKNCGRRF